MPRGGARVNSGPPPDPNALRRERSDHAPKDGWTILPSDGRQGGAPEWPFAESFTGEPTLWAELWRTPQSVEWERLGFLREVATYCRLMIIGEVGSVAALTEARQWSDRLGLNPAAMLRNRWRVAPADAPKPAAKKPAKRAASGARARLRAVPDA